MKLYVPNSMRAFRDEALLRVLRKPAGKFLVFTEDGSIPAAQTDPIFANLNRQGNDKAWEVRREHALERDYWKKIPFEVVFLQSRWDTPQAELVELIVQVRAVRPDAKVVYLDWYAPLHLPNPYLFDLVDLYMKKQVLIDRDEYTRGMCDTNLVEYEAQWDSSLLPPRGEGVKQSLVDSKLIVGWNFATSSALLRELKKKRYTNSHRPHTLHCRMHVPDTDATWYGHMRRRCLQAVQKIDLPDAVIETSRVSQTQFLNELAFSKVCFSPFGYGEVCWRDFEAILCGALLLKPDMSHLETNPNIYIPYETYVPVRWDLEDLCSQATRYAKDSNARGQIVANAIAAWRRYVDGEWECQWTKLLEAICCIS